jgi:hypothetical protein
MFSDLELTDLGPELNSSASISLQRAVLRKIEAQTEAIVLRHAGESESAEEFPAMRVLLSLPEERRLRIMLHPSFRFWLQAMRRTSLPELAAIRRDFLARLTDFVWSEPICSPAVKSWRVMTDDCGGLRCSTAGRFVELGMRYANQAVEATPATEEVIVRCQDGLTIKIPYEDLEGSIVDPPPSIDEHGYYLTVSPRVLEGQIEVSQRDPWLRVVLSGTNQRTDGAKFFEVDGECYPGNYRLDVFTDAFDMIKTVWPEAYDDFANFTRVIVPFMPHPDRLGGTNKTAYFAFTVSSRQGAIYIADAPVNSTVEMLIHENAHVKLRQIQVIDPLLQDPLDESVCLTVPWRPDPRPIPGILEGLFVFSHVAEFEFRLWQRVPEKIRFDRLTARMNDLHYAADCLAQKAPFTRQGERFITAMREWVSNLDARLKRQTKKDGEAVCRQHSSGVRAATHMRSRRDREQ